MSGGEQARFFGKFARLVQAGIPLLRAFEVASGGVEEEGLGAALGRALVRCYGGSSLHDALAAEPGLFAPEVLCLVGEGERAGDVEKKAAVIAEGLSNGDFAEGRTGETPEGGDGGLAVLLARARAEGATAVHVGPGGVRLRAAGGLVPAAEAAEVPGLLRELRRRGPRFREGNLRVRAALLSGPEGPMAVLSLLPGEGRTLAGAGLGAEQVREVGMWLGRRGAVVLAAGPLGHGVEALLEGMVAALDREGRRVVTAGAADLPGVIVVAGTEADLAACDADVLVLGPPAGEETLRTALRSALQGALVLVGMDAPNARAAIRRARGASPDAADAVLAGAVDAGGGADPAARVVPSGGGGTPPPVPPEGE